MNPNRNLKRGTIMKSHHGRRAASTLNSLTIAVLLGIAVTAAADTGSEIFLAKGFQPNLAYQVNEFDSVNTMNGNLILKAPLGPVFKTNGSLSYSFELTYNADHWFNVAYPVVDLVGVTDPTFGHAVSASGGPNPDGPDALYEAVPSGNAGIGWSFSLGSYGESATITTWIAGGYTEPDGASHAFSPTMHGDSTTSGTPPPSDVAYSTDGTYLRVRRGAPASDGRPTREVQSPDGVLRHFVCTAPVAADCTGKFGKNPYALDWMSDPFGNVLLIERNFPSQPITGNWIWTITEGTLPNAEGRTNPYYQTSDRNSVRTIRQHKLTFDFVLNFQSRLVRAEIAGFDNIVSVYIPHYELRNILRPPSYPYDPCHGFLPCSDPPLYIPYNPDKSISVYMLTSLELPAGGGSWKYDYYSGSVSDKSLKSTFKAFDAELYAGGDSGVGVYNNPNGYFRYETTDDAGNPVVLTQGDPVLGASQPYLPTVYYEWRLSDGRGGTVVYPTSKIAGRIRKVQAPTGGGYRYTYGLRAYPTAGCHVLTPRDRPAHPAILMVGVATRLQIDENSNPIGKAWVYAGSSYRPLGGPFCDAFGGEFIGSVLEPNGRLTLSFFNVKERDPYFSAPISPFETTTSPVSGTRSLTARIYSVDYDTYSADLFGRVRALFARYRGTSTASPATLLRSIYSQYELSNSTCGLVDSEGYCRVFNLRRVAELTKYETEDPNAYIEEIHSGFDGLGNFRRTDKYSNFRQLSEPSVGLQEHRVDYQGFNPGVSYAAGALNPVGLPAKDGPWLMLTYSHTTAWENGVVAGENGRVAHARYFFDPLRGFLAAKRSVVTSELASAPADLAASVLPVKPNDLLVTYSRSTDDSSTEPATIVNERYYGGTSKNANGVLGTSWLTPEGLPSTNNTDPDFRIRSVYRYGTLAKTEYLDQCDNAMLQKYTAAIDKGTGLPAAEIDSSGLQTTYSYDALGRITKATPPGETPQVYEYSVGLATGTRNKLLVGRPIATAAGDPQPAPTYEFIYDHLGRLISESHTSPGTSPTSPNTARKTYSYNVFGDRENESVWTFATTAPKRWFTYDLFHRVTKTTAPDGFKVEATYTGDREVNSKTFGVALKGTATVATQTRTFDGFGRTSEASDGLLHAKYAYDALGNIRSAALNAVGSSSPVQTRWFGYDGTGALITENHPELAPFGVHHERIDARGHSRKLVYRNNGVEDAAFGLSYEYDRAERLTKVSSAANVTLKQYSYYASNCSGCTAAEKTRLASARRFNVIVNPRAESEPMTVEVKETYHYHSATGRLASILTSASGSATANPATAYSFSMAGTVGYAYNSLGQLTSVSYPPEAGPGRYIANVYDNGMITKVKQVAPTLADRAALQYDANGIATRVTFGTANVYDVTDIDALGMPRPRKITWKYVGGSKAVGDYVYDGMGNIKQIDYPGGSDLFLYDSASRLVEATVSGNKQTYTYDAFGNLSSLDGFNKRFFGVSGSSNRLTSVPGGSIAYDNAGNVKSMSDSRPARAGRSINYTFDAFSVMARVDTGLFGAAAYGDFGRLFLYTASDERVAVIDYRDPAGIREQWSFRDTGNRVIRDLEKKPGGGWVWAKDYVYRGSSLNSTIAPSAAGGEAVRDAHLDHLGTVRLETDAAGQVVDGERKYMPFGEPLVKTPLAERMAFTGHERDDSGTASYEADLDYMHARYYSAFGGRFLSVDPARSSATASDPQSWNRYAYSGNSPLNHLDPNGREWRRFAAAAGVERLIDRLATRAPEVGATLNRYDGPNNPDLDFQIRDIGKGRPGDDAGLFEANPINESSLKYDVSRMNPAGDPNEFFPATGNFLAGATGYKGGVITLDDGLDLNAVKIDSETARVLFHEIGHADLAARDFLTYLKVIADDKTSGIKHDDREVEKDANDYAQRNCQASRLCPP